MAVKFKMTADRLSSVCTLSEYLGALNGNLGAMIKILPKVAVDEQGKYIVTAQLDDDGDISGYDNLEQAQALLDNLTPDRLKKLSLEILGTFRDVVNPTKDGSSKKLSSTEPEPPPTGS